MINTQYYSQNTYSGLYFSVLDANNLIYKVVYIYSLLALAATLGFVLSILMAIISALIEFVNLFLLRPTLKIGYILINTCVVPMIWVANLLRPILELVFPGTLKNVPVLKKLFKKDS